ncbi:MAG: lysophospholipid acyltransferase family protein, partial [Candidatus Omnitrophota bacterium]
LVKWAVKIARLISIDPVTHLTEALQASRFVLEHNKLICVFPEGVRSVDTRIQEFKKGIGILAKELNIPLIPVYIKGSHHTWPRTKRFPRLCPLKIIFGKPVFWQDLGNDYETVARGLRQEVLKLKAGEGEN